MALGLGLYLGLTRPSGARVFQPASGLISLPPWLSQTSPSNRTCQNSLSTLLRNVGANQACANVWGWQCEPQSQNLIHYSEAFGSWTAFSSTTINAYTTDPAGNSTGIDLSASNPGAQGLYLLFSGSASTVAARSSWIKSAAAPNIATIDSQSPLNQYVENPVTGSAWHRVVAQYSGTSQTPVQADVGLSTTINTRAQYAFEQLENQPCVTSYIPTAGTQVTRAATTQNFAPGSTSFGFRMDLVMACASTVGLASVLLCSPTGTYVLGLNASNQLYLTSGNTQTRATAYTWNAGDILSIRMRFNGTTTSTFQVYKNNVFIESFSLTNSSAPAWGTSGNYLFASNAGANYLLNQGIPHLELY